MPLKTDAEIEITALAWVPPMAHGLVKDLRVRWALEEAGLDYRVRLLSAERSDDYLQEQPFNQVPSFRDAKVQIFETGAILLYLGEQSEALLPRETQARFRAIQWSFAAVNSVEPAVQNRALLNGPYAGQEWAELSKPTADAMARLRLRRLSDWLGEKSWLEGDGFTIGDLIMITVLRLADRAKLLGETPNLAAYLVRGQERPAFKQALEDQLAAFNANQPQEVAA